MDDWVLGVRGGARWKARRGAIGQIASKSTGAPQRPAQNLPNQPRIGQTDGGMCVRACVCVLAFACLRMRVSVCVCVRIWTNKKHSDMFLFFFHCFLAEHGLLCFWAEHGLRSFFHFPLFLDRNTESTSQPKSTSWPNNCRKPPEHCQSEP